MLARYLTRQAGCPAYYPAMYVMLEKGRRDAHLGGRQVPALISAGVFLGTGGHALPAPCILPRVGDSQRFRKGLISDYCCRRTVHFSWRCGYNEAHLGLSPHRSQYTHTNHNIRGGNYVSKTIEDCPRKRECSLVHELHNWSLTRGI